MAQRVNNLPAIDQKTSRRPAEDQARSLGGEDPLEKGMATHSNILAWRIPWTEEPGGLCINYMIVSVDFLVYLI